MQTLHDSSFGAETCLPHPLALSRPTELSIAFGSNWPASRRRGPPRLLACRHGQPCELESEMLRKSYRRAGSHTRLEALCFHGRG